MKTNERRTEALRLFSRIASAIVTLEGLCALLGWALDVPVLMSIVPGITAMNPVTAVCFILTGLSLLLQGFSSGTKKDLPGRIGRACALLVALVASAKLFDLLGYRLDIDQVLFREKLQMHTPPNRMAPNTTVNFLLVCFSLLFYDFRTKRGHRPSEFTALLSFAISALALVGYINGVRSLYGFASFVPMALTTAVAFAFVSLGFLSAHPVDGIAGIIVSEGAGGRMARFLLPSVIGVPIILGWLRLQGEVVFHFYNTEFGVCITVISSIVILAAIVLLNARSINRLDAERSKQEESVRASEARYRSARDTLSEAQKIAHLGSFEYIAADRTTLWSEEEFRIYGLDPAGPSPAYDEMLEKYIYCEDAPILHETFTKAMESRSTYELEHRIRRPDGSIRWVHDRAHPYCDKQGALVRYIGTTLDITERKHAEEEIKKHRDRLEEKVSDRTADLRAANRELGSSNEHLRAAEQQLSASNQQLRANEQQLRAANQQLRANEMENRQTALYTRNLIEASLDPLVTISKDGKITDVNEAAVRATGVPRDDLVGTDFSGYFTDPGKAQEGYLRVFDKGEVRDYPLTLKNKNGTTVEVLYNATVYYDTKGNVGGVFAAARDITTLRRAEKMVGEERKRLFNVLETIPTMVSLLTPDHRIAFANRSFIDMFGEPGSRFCYECCFGKSEPCDFCESYRVFETGKPHHWELNTPDGKIIDAHDFPFVDADGSFLILEMDIDITEQRKVQKDLLESRAEIERGKRLSDIGVLAATVAHELRNPLAAIGMAAYNIRRKARNADIERQLGTITMKVAESDQIINNLLFYSRLRQPRFDRIDIRKIINECTEELARKGKKSITLKKELAALKESIIEADALQMKEVFHNILNNALDAVPVEGGVIGISADNEKDSIAIRIEDNGPGIDEGIITRVFDPFFSTKAKGTGLGLSVCKQIVNMHSGKIEVANVAGQGVSVILHLPRKRAE